MSDLNCYNITGRLGADATVKFSQSGTAIWNGRVAVGWGWGENKGTNWVTVKVFGKRAESLGKMELAKGTHIACSGELRMEEYERKDGGKGMGVDLIVQDVVLLGSKADREAAPSRQAPAASDEFGDEPMPF